MTTTAAYPEVLAAVVTIKDTAGKLHYRYQGATIDPGFAAPGELERLQNRGMVSRPGAAASTTGDEVPTGGAKDVLAWVGEDRLRASRAMEVELARPTQRAGVITPLRRLLGLPPDTTPAPGTSTGPGSTSSQDNDGSQPKDPAGS